MSVFKDEKGRWGFSVRYTDAFGTRKQKKSVNKNWTKKQAKLEEEKFLNENNQTAITMDELRDLYIKSKTNHIKWSSMYTKDMKYKNHIAPYFGKFPITKITEATIERWQDELLKKGLSDGTLNGIQGELISMINFAFRRNLITRPLVINHISTNKPLERKEKTITRQQFDMICEELSNNRVTYACVQLLYYSGMRIGEALALTNLDIEGNVIHVTKGKAHNGSITSPKTNKMRSVVVSDRIIGILNEQINYYRACGIKGTVYLFGGDKPYTHSAIQLQYRTTCDKLGISPRNVHALRHTHVSNLIALGYNVFEISERTGHSVEMINKVYGHVINNPQKSMAERLENM